MQDRCVERRRDARERPRKVGCRLSGRTLAFRARKVGSIPTANVCVPLLSPPAGAAGSSGRPSFFEPLARCGARMLTAAEILNQLTKAHEDGDILTQSELCRLLGITSEMTTRLARRLNLPRVRLGTTVFYDTASVRAQIPGFLEQQTAAVQAVRRARRLERRSPPQAAQSPRSGPLLSADPNGPAVAPRRPEPLSGPPQWRQRDGDS